MVGWLVFVATVDVVFPPPPSTPSTFNCSYVVRKTTNIFPCVFACVYVSLPVSVSLPLINIPSDRLIKSKHIATKYYSNDFSVCFPVSYLRVSLFWSVCLSVFLYYRTQTCTWHLHLHMAQSHSLTIRWTVTAFCACRQTYFRIPYRR